MVRMIEKADPLNLILDIYKGEEGLVDTGDIVKRRHGHRKYASFGELML